MNDEEKKKRDQLIIMFAALLHDIGKFYQRSDEKNNKLSEEIRYNEALYCPSKQNIYTHKHSLYTHDCLENLLQFDFMKLDKDSRTKIIELASKHHNPSNDNIYELIIQKADHLSSGLDRFENKDNEKNDYREFKKIPFESIFSKIKIKNNDDEKKYYYPLVDSNFDTEANAKSSVFPKTDKPEMNYREYYEKFKTDWDLLISAMGKYNDNIIITSIVSLLRKYLWCIPSDTIKNPDLSLFDHSYTTAAIAVALYEYHYEKGIDSKVNSKDIENNDLKKFIILSGDLSGIQKYLLHTFEENTKGSSKILRGRSFFISQVQNIVIHHILKELNLPITQKIKDAGGNFELLLPNTEDVRNSLKKIEKEIHEYCLKELNGELNIILSYDNELTHEDINGKNYANLKIELANKMNIKKKQALYTVLNKQSDWVIEDNYKEMQIEVCPHCKREGAKKIGDEKWGKYCYYFNKELGQKMTSNPYIVLYDRETEDNYPTILNNYQLLFKKELPIENDENVIAFWKQRIGKNDEQNNNTDRIYPELEMCTFIPRYTPKDEHFNNEWAKWYENYKSNNDEELHNNNALTFRHIAYYKKCDYGAPLIGILKGDVDNLGQIFNRGLENHKNSMSRYSSMSRQLNSFFTIYINYILINKYPYIYTLYSGGDDFCFIGPWDELIDFAKNLYDDFKKFVCYNKDITFSAGIYIIHPNYPVHRAIEYAESELEKAKDEGKNRITIFGKPICWDGEFKEFEDLSKIFYKNMLREGEEDTNTEIEKDSKKKMLSRGFLYRLLHYQKLADEYFNKKEKKENPIANLLYHSHLMYDVYRNLSVEDKDKDNLMNLPDNLKFINDLIGEARYIKDTYKKYWSKLDLSLFRALYKSRKK